MMNRPNYETEVGILVTLQRVYRLSFQQLSA